MAKDPPPDEGDSGSIPGQGTKIPHSAGQLSLRAATTEPTALHSPQLERSLYFSRKRSRMTQQRSHVPQLKSDTPK